MTLVISECIQSCVSLVIMLSPHPILPACCMHACAAVERESEPVVEKDVMLWCHKLVTPMTNILQLFSRSSYAFLQPSSSSNPARLSSDTQRQWADQEKDTESDVPTSD
jgi:hypothetical protein